TMCPPLVDDVASIEYAVRPVPAREVVFPAITDMHSASMLESSAEAAAWRASPLRRGMQPPQGDVFDLRPLAIDEQPETPIEDVILSRRSTRHYDTGTPLAFSHLSTVLRASLGRFDVDR